MQSAESVNTDTPASEQAVAAYMAKHLSELDAQGYTIIPNFLTADTLTRVREGLAPHLSTHAGRNNFEGFKTGQLENAQKGLCVCF
jgi:hypothetical protein